MRFRGLILSDDGDEARVDFHERFTIVAGLPEDARAVLIDSLLGAADGSDPDAAIEAVDAQGRHFLVRGGRSTWATGGEAPSLIGDVVPDARTLRRLMLLTAPDLGLPAGRPDARDQSELIAARAAREELRNELVLAQGAEPDPELVAELAALDARLRDADEAEVRAAHWAALTASVDLARKLAELDELVASAGTDAATIAAADRVGAAAQARADAVRRRDAARRSVKLAMKALDNPADMHADPETEGPHPDGLESATRAWREGVRAARRAESELAAHLDDRPVAGLDRRIGLLAPLHQDELWAAHARVRSAESAWEAASVQHEAEADALSFDSESEIDAAHVERVRAEEAASTAFRSGILGASIMAVGALLLASVHILACVLLLAFTGVVATFTIVLPQVRVRAAFAKERAKLAAVGADSYLGLHLRRLDEDDTDARRALEAAARERTAATIAWKELVGHLDPADADGLEEEVRAWSVRWNPTTRARREKELRAATDAAVAARDRAGASLRAVAEELQAIVDAAEADIAAADAVASEVATSLGVEPGPGATEQIARLRLEAVRRDQQRAAAGPRELLVADLERLGAEAERLARPGWDAPPPPSPKSSALTLLQRRRDDLAAQVAEVEQRAEVVGRRFEAVCKKVHDLEVRLGEAAGSSDVDGIAKRMLGQLARARTGGTNGTNGEALPVLLDDPLVRVAVDRRCDLLDMLLRVGERMQLVLFTEDPVAARWARSKADMGLLTLHEPAVEAV